MWTPRSGAVMMNLDRQDPPPPYEASKDESLDDILEPETLLFRDQSVVSDTKATATLYRMNWDITSIPQRGSSVVFERVGEDNPLESKDLASIKRRDEHIFYLAHPASAKYQNETPGYYLTSVSSESLGNICLKTSKSAFQKTEFRMLISTGRTWSDQPLFDEDAKPLFEVKPKWMGGRYIWSNCNGEQVAYEDKKGDQQVLVITAPVKRKLRDALVATWCLRLWYETAESTQARRDEMERLTPAEGLKGHADLKLAKRIGALGSLGGAGA
ncbi:hypothetical protein F4805DRAFT_457029 [Annulohypoxylon moriforme]|nr:hypothetical protein F4805DRAFT_457029 [Annulohypoxylon moriforme]